MQENAGCRHAGVIMDGNGRWAAERGLARTSGHQEGLKAARRIVEAASILGLPFITLYVFSTENWKRAVSEVNFIMNLVETHLLREMDFYKSRGIRIRHAGDRSALSAGVNDCIDKAIEETRFFTGTQVVLALNYGGRDEIIRAIKKALSGGLTDSLSNGLTETSFAQFLDNPDIPDPDLIVRTAGERRSSNFLLWEAAYAEYYFSQKYWPDWTGDDLKAALDDYNGRERRFGAVGGKV